MSTHAEPWQQRDDWASGWLESETGDRTAVVFLWCFTLVWNAVSWFVMIETLRGNVGGDTEIAPFFPAVGFGIFLLAVYVTRQRSKWGRSRLELLTRPGVLGGPLRCVLHASPALAGAEALEVSIDCVGSDPGGGKFRLIKHLWHYEEHVPATRFELGEETRVPLDFRLPHGLPESDPRRASESPVWALKVHARVPGVDYEARFELPVFRTSESSPEEEGSRVQAPRVPTSWRATPDAGAVLALPDSKIRVRPWATGGRQFVFGMLRHPWMGLFTLIATLFFCGLSAAIHYADGPGFFLLVFVSATLLLAYASLDTLFAVTRVRADRGRIQVRHGPSASDPRARCTSTRSIASA